MLETHWSAGRPLPASANGQSTTVRMEIRVLSFAAVPVAQAHDLLAIKDGVRRVLLARLGNRHEVTASL